MRVLQGILLSLLIHFLFVWGAQYAPLLAHRPESKAITVEILDRPFQNETGTIVRESLIPEKLKAQESEDPLKFLSRQTQRVRQQTRALINGMTQNRAAQAPSQTKKARPDGNPMNQKNFDAFAPAYQKKPAAMAAQDLQLEQGLSTIGEALPQEVAVGSFTALNTDRYLYYSFYARIEELIRFRWETAVRNAIDTTPPDRFGSNIRGLWNTQIEVWLKPSGELHSVHLMKESGLKAFDQSAIQSFIQARVFPNPPKEMVESDGLIHVKYAFQVTYSPKVLVKSRQ
ncbi:MAG: energy transducer TonB [Bdellovibrio sp. CG10_big_fil_rev_8_21_14_0_10_47_8]|nr:MAG: energy transducer TonB [Bdellovibrio sp. CG10_big_fil_rev_8_21_14_0_10_47_8]